MFDVTAVPFSYFESYMSLSIPRRKDGLYLRNHHGGGNDLFPVRTIADGDVVTPDIAARPWVLTLSHGEGRVEICFERSGTLRMRGQGLGLQLGEKLLAYAESNTHFVINCRPATRRYEFEVLRGSFELRGVNPEKAAGPKVAVISPDNDGGWEIAIDEFWSTWQRPSRASFDDCLAAAEKAFGEFLDSMPAARPQDAQTRALAAYVDWASTVGPCGHIKRPSLLMSKNWMCNVWSWDQCFNAMALAAGQPTLALDQMLTLVDHQDEFGSYPDSVNDVWMHFNFSKPPVHGWAFSEILARMSEPPTDDVMRTVYASLGRQADWWMTHRRMEGHRLPYYLHGNDSGWDNSTMFDRGVPLIAPDLAALLVTQMDVLSTLAERLGRGDEAKTWKTRSEEIYDAVMAELWRGDHFVACLALDGSDVESQSLIPWLPLILGARLPEDARSALKKGIEGHLTEWGLATERVDSPQYKSDGYWRGPIWAPSTYIAFTGLVRAGFTDLADEVAARFCKLCGASGFAENFDAVTGAPLCDKAYTWTASVFLLLAERMNQR
jgi:glycogen debranching enzyme